MKINQKQCLYSVVIMGAGALWMADRFVLGTSVTAPGSANASSLAVGRDQGTLSLRTESTVPAAAPPATLAERFGTSMESADAVSARGKDLFTPPESWLPRARSERAAQPTIMAGADPEQFRKEHKLKAILCAGRRCQVVVNDKMVSADQVIDNFRLASVTNTSATFAGNGIVVTLRLDQPVDLGSPLSTLHP